MNNKISFIRRMVALALSAAMIISMIATPVFAGGANGYSFRWRTNDLMNDDLSIYSGSVSPERNDEVLLEWTYNDMFINEPMTLTYHLKDKREVVFTIKRLASGVVEVSYGIKDLNQPLTPLILSEIEKYQVYDQAKGIFVAPNLIANSNPNFSVTTDFGDKAELRFSIIENQGFAFMLEDGTRVRFKWNTASRLFQFSTNKAAAVSRYYDFTLSNNSVDINTGSDTKSIMLNCLTGIAQSTFKCVPFDAGQTTPSSPAPYPSYVANNLSKAGTIVDQTNPSSLAPDPANDCGVYLTVDIPTTWDSISGTFKTQPKSHANIKINIAVSNFTTITISNLYTADDTLIDVTATGNAVIGKITGTATTITVPLTNLPPSTLFDRSFVSFTAINADEGHSFDSRITNLGSESIYTFLEYKMVNFGPDKFFLEVRPYCYYSQVPDEFGNRRTTAGYYRLYANDDRNFNDNNIVVRNLKDNLDAPRLYIPVSLSLYGGNSKVQWFMIDYSTTPFAPTGGPYIQSQQLGYKPDPASMKLGEPEDLQIISSSVITDESGNEFLQVRMKWTAGPYDILKSLMEAPSAQSFDFHFYRAETPSGHDYDKNLTLNPAKDVDEWLTVRLTPDMTNIADTKSKSSLTNIPLDDTMKAVIVPGTAVVGVESSTKVRDVNIVTCEVTVRIPISAKDEPVIPSPFFRYPGLYYVSERASYTKVNKYVTPENVAVPLTINGPAKYEVPQPQNVQAVTPVEISDAFDMRAIDLSWNSIWEKHLASYREYMLNPKGYTLKNDGQDSVSYNIYVTTSRTQMDELLKYSGQKDKSGLASLVTVGLLPSNNSGTMQMSDAEVEGFLNNLRSGKVVCLSGMEQLNANIESQLLELLRMDMNQVYYFAVETQITPFKLKSDGSIDESAKANESDVITRVSKLSDIVSVTTKTDREEPTDDYLTPRIPKIFNKKGITLSKATVYWQFTPALSTDEEAKFQYELIRIKDFMLTDIVDGDVVLSSKFQKIPLSEVMANISAYNANWKTAAWKTSGTGASSITKPYGENKAASTYSYEKIGEEFNLTDSDLIPNQVYYYYLRVIKVVNGAETAYSDWIGLSVTTDPVQAPTDLVVERGGTYDKKTQIPISFNSMIDLRIASNAAAFRFEYSIKMDGEDWQTPVTMAVSSLTMTDSAKQDNTHYEYTINNVIPGKSYSVRVRMAQLISGEWIFSPYSAVATTKTDIDPEEAALDGKANEWFEYLKNMLGKLIRQPYWVVEDTVNAHTGLYRTATIDGEFAKNPGTSYNLGKAAPMQVYYLPSKVLEKAIAVNEKFVINYENIQIVIPAKVFDPSTSAVQKAVTDVKEKKAADYYVRITVRMTSFTGTAGDSAAISPKIELQAEIVNEKEQDGAFDLSIETNLITLVSNAAASKNYSADIKDMLKSGKTNEEMVKFIDSLVTEVQSGFRTQLQSKLKSNLGTSYLHTGFGDKVTVIGKFATGVAAKAAKLVNALWVSQVVSAVVGGVSFVTTENGTFIFTGSLLTVPGIDSLAGAEVLKSIIVKYGLEDFLGKNGTINLDDKVSNQMIAGTAARLLGADKNADIAKFLNDKGITVNSRTLYSNANQQDMLYLMMNVYEGKTKTKMSSMRITDYNKANKFTGIDSKNLLSVRCAFEIGLIKDSDFSPNGTITIRVFLSVLNNLNSKVKL